MRQRVGLGVALLLLAAAAQAALNGSLVNGSFEQGPLGGGWNPGPPAGWVQYSAYTAGVWGTNTVPISGGGGGVGAINANTARTNAGYLFQSLGTVEVSDVGKVFVLSGGAAAWDWYAGGTLYGKGNAVASFRTAVSTSAYGSLLGRASTICGNITTGTDGLQNGVGDNGNFLQPLSAAYAPTTDDIGRTVYAVIDLNQISLSGGGGERRFVFDNFTLSVTNSYPGLATNLANGGFDSANPVSFDPRVAGWLEHETYGSIGPSGSGNGVWTWFGGTINGASGGALSLIPGAVGRNQATAMQSLGFVGTNDVGRTFKFSVGARAWDWWTNTTCLGTITASFRSGMSPDGESVDFRYGFLLGTPGVLTTGLTNSNGTQDGIGDDGNSLSPLIAIYTVAPGDIGREVFAALNLDCLVLGGSAENRYVVDNASLTVSTNPPPFVVITSPANGASFAVPNELTITASATASQTSIAAVEFFVGAQSVGRVTNPPYTLTLTNIKGGPLICSARATDLLGASAHSAVVTVTNIASRPLITDVHPGADGTVGLAWTSLPGAGYAVETSSNLGSWADVAAGIPSGGSLTSIVITNPATQPALYFRVRRLQWIQITEVNTPSDGTGYTTFQSHNQKVVANSNGIFMTYLDTGADNSPSVWRLARSTNGGLTFATVYQGSDLTRAPAMETDADGHIYLTYPTFGSSTHFLRFTAANGYTAPDISRTYNGVSSAAKYAMACDRRRQRFYHATQDGRLLTLDMTGNLLNNRQVFSSSQGNSATAYPHLFVDADGVLHLAYTTADDGNHIPYESIRYLKSPDGGTTWQTMGGLAVGTPATPEPAGLSDMINLPDEVTPWATWLSAMHVKSGKVHFTYRMVNPWDPAYFGIVTPTVERQHYMRLDAFTGVRELDSWAASGGWTGTDLSIAAVDGLLASDPDAPSGPLHAVARTSDGHLSALLSCNNGSTWVDYATSGVAFSQIYAVGGCRTLTPDGKVIGSFTGKLNPGDPWRTYFYSFPACGAP